MEETNTDTVETENVTPEAETEVTPDVEETQVTPDTEETKEEVEETAKVEAPGETKKPLIEGLTYETPEDLIQGVKEKDSTITKLSQEIAELKKAQEEKQFEQQKTQVETGNTQLKQGYQNDLNQLKANKQELRAQAKAKMLEGEIQEYEYDEYLAQLDESYEATKGQIDAYYKEYEIKLTQQQKELLSATQQRNLQEFKAENPEFCEQYQPVVDKYLELGYDPKELGVVKQLLDIALTTEKAKNNLLNENNEAKGKLVSTATGVTPAPTEEQIPTSWNAIVDKMDKNPDWYYKNLAKISEMKEQGLIK